MSVPTAFALTVMVLVVATYIYVRLPPRGRKWECLELNRSFDGLLLFGLDRSYVYVSDLKLKMTVKFIKRIRDDSTIALEVHIPEFADSTLTRDKILTEFNVLKQSFDVAWSVPVAREKLMILNLGGPGIEAPGALEGAARIIVRALGTSPGSHYRAEFKGPKDIQKINEYFDLRT